MRLSSGREEVGQAAVAGQHDADQGAGVELRAGQQAQLAEDDGRHLLGFVDQEHGAEQRALQMGQPPLAQGLEPVPAVVRREGDAEEVAELAVEVGDVTFADERLGRLVQIPLEVTGHAGAIIEHAEQPRPAPRAAAAEDLA